MAMPTAKVTKRLMSYPSGRMALRAFLARPNRRGPFPGLLVIQEWWGLNAHIMDVAARFAKQG